MADIGGGIIGGVIALILKDLYERGKIPKDEYDRFVRVGVPDIKIPEITISPVTSRVGIVKFDYYSGLSATYQKIAEWEVTEAMKGFVHDISFGVASGGEDYAEFKVEIADVTHFDGKKAIGQGTFSFNGAYEIEGGKKVIVYVKSDGANAIKANGLITGVER